jgi:hypothetical protein
MESSDCTRTGSKSTVPKYFLKRRGLTLKPCNTGKATPNAFHCHVLNWTNREHAIKNLSNILFMSISMTFKSISSCTELVACVAMVARSYVCQVLWLDMALDGAVVRGGVFAFRASHRPVRKPDEAASELRIQWPMYYIVRMVTKFRDISQQFLNYFATVRNYFAKVKPAKLRNHPSPKCNCLSVFRNRIFIRINWIRFRDIAS